jgi:antitoxin component YwqK of YwqJK toxin-antitoxin module
MNNKILLLICIISLYSCKYKPETTIANKLNQVVYDEKQGLFIEFDSLGRVTALVNYKYNVKNGLCLKFNEKGNLKWFEYFKNGKENGTSYTFFPSGYLECGRVWEQGKKKGGLAFDYVDSTFNFKAMMFYSKEGNLIERNNYDLNGKLIKKEGVAPYILPSRSLPVFSIQNELK